PAVGALQRLPLVTQPRRAPTAPTARAGRATAAPLSPSHRRRAPQQAAATPPRPWLVRYRFRLTATLPLPAGTPPPQGWRLIPALTCRSGIELSMLETAGKRVSRPVRNSSNPASPSVTTRSR